MGAPTSSATSTTAATRLKREDFRRTKHDSAFSKWKILIGASDWEDHLMGKEGAERYRTQNLPNWISCPGVYELGIAPSRPRSGKGARKLDSTSVVPVYLGQADNLRTRLQQYGRDGAHLETRSSNEKVTNCQSVKRLGLFKDTFSRGLPIVYRCAPMRSKKEAERTEKELLDKFDYAWNKGSNGARRQDDIFKKLNSFAKASRFSLLAKKILFYNPKQVGIKISIPEPSLSQNEDKRVIFSRIFGIKRLQSRETHSAPGDYCISGICGVAIGHGSICTVPPVEGRKRCALHKGMRINGSIQNGKQMKKRASCHLIITLILVLNKVLMKSSSPLFVDLSWMTALLLKGSLSKKIKGVWSIKEEGFVKCNCSLLENKNIFQLETDQEQVFPIEELVFWE